MDNQGRLDQSNCSCGCEQQINDLTNQIDLFRSSISWKITYPLRWFFYFPVNLVLIMFRRLEPAISTVAGNHPNGTQKMIRLLKLFPPLYGFASKRLALARGFKENQLDPIASILEVLEQTQSTRLFHVKDQATAPKGSSDITIKMFFNLGSVLYFQHKTGIQRVVLELAKSLCDSNNLEVHPICWDKKLSKFRAVNEQQLISLHEQGGPQPNAWQTDVDVFEYGTHNWFLDADFSTDDDPVEILKMLDFLKQFNMNTCRIFYDSIPHKFPFLYPRKISENHLKFMIELMSYDKVLPISVESANELASELIRFGFDESIIRSKIHPIEIAGGFTSNPRGRQHAMPSKELCNIIVISTLEHRKNHKTLLEAFKMANESLGGPLRLHIVGYPAYSDVEMLIRDHVNDFSEITWHKNLEDSKLGALLEKCDFSIYPSLYEGYGLPIVESLWNHTPCICANWGSMSDIAELGGCLTVDVSSPFALSDAIIQLYGDNRLLDRLTNEATSREFQTWANYSRLLRDALISA